MSEERLAEARALRAAGRLHEAGALLSSLAQHDEASRVLEEACDFDGAARAALLAGELERAVVLAAQSGRSERLDEALARAREGLSEARLSVLAGSLDARGFGEPAGALHATLGDHGAAALSLARAGDALGAAREHELAGAPAEAAKLLEAAVRREPHRHELRLALGRLFVRHGRSDAALRALQAVPPEAPERRAALSTLVPLLSRLGLEAAVGELTSELEALGGAQDEHAAEARVEGGRERVLFGRYEVVREVASTPNARVLEAHDRVAADRVAVKLLAPTLLEGSGRDALLRFEREARALAQLRHPHVVALREWQPEGPALVLEWMEGGSVRELLDGGEPIAPARAAEITLAVLSALGEAHRLGVLHRDVKPTNVLFDAVGTPHLADFGAAHLGDLTATATAATIGTLAYMSPEQRAGAPATVASDVYGAGALFCELLTGEPPAADRPVFALRDVHDELGPAHEAVLGALLAPAASERPDDTFAARKLIGGVAWPTRALPRARRLLRRSTAPPPAPGAARLEPGREGYCPTGCERARDAWSARDVLLVPLDEAELTRARALAKGAHPGLPTVLRVDDAAARLWLEAPRGRSLAAVGRALDASERAALRAVVAALHDLGLVHGRLDREHVLVGETSPAGEVDVVLGYTTAREAEGRSFADDERALDAL